VSQERFIQIIAELLQREANELQQNLLFQFENTQDAALHNDLILKHFNYNLHDAIIAQQNSQVMYGSEFKPPNHLEELLFVHPNWKKLKQILLEGATFPLSPISTEERKLDLDFHLDRGNHSISAIQNKKALDDLIDKDIKLGFALPLPIQSLFSKPNASIAPLGCQEQETINTNGECIHEFRMTHDQTFSGPSGKSVNLRVIKEDLPPCMYSFVLSRILHYIVDLRYRHPQTKIFLCKFDIDSAYHQCHLSSSMASESMTIHGNLLPIALRLTFGGAPCPPLWGLISETMIDGCNSLIINKFWDHKILFDPI